MSHMQRVCAVTSSVPSAECPLLASIAQTNLQLNLQLHRVGYAASDLAEIRNDYDLASALFADRFRPSGKPFLAHLVGTASILAKLHASRQVVAAGLLHAAYAQGTFPSGFAGMTKANRAHVADRVGCDVEGLVAAYTTFAWTNEVISASLVSAENEVLWLMRVANELEDYLDLGMRYCDKDKKVDPRRRELCIGLAQRLGQPALAAALKQVYRETDENEWPGSLGSGRKASYRLPAPRRSRLAMLGYRFLRARPGKG